MCWRDIHTYLRTIHVRIHSRAYLFTRIYDHSSLMRSCWQDSVRINFNAMVRNTDINLQLYLLSTTRNGFVECLLSTTGEVSISLLTPDNSWVFFIIIFPDPVRKLFSWRNNSCQKGKRANVWRSKVIVTLAISHLTKNHVSTTWTPRSASNAVSYLYHL